MKILIAHKPMVLEIATFFGYFIVLLIVAFFSTKKQKSDTDFIIGNRSLNFWLTALSAHASDMSSWLFLGYPALIFTTGLFSSWAAIGLVVFMFLNWQFIAPKIRVVTEEYNSLTLSSYFEARFSDKSSKIRIVSAIWSIFFFTIYISSGLVGLGLLVESLFDLSYLLGISLGLLIVVGYVLAGGYKTIAYIDLFQGFFLLSVIVFIPTYLIVKNGGFTPIMDAVAQKHLTTSLFPDFSGKTLWTICTMSLGWGLGYFGQPHIITKFMGIHKVSDMRKAQYLGISWQSIALAAATCVGLVGIFIFPEGLQDPEQVILQTVQATLSPIVAGLVLCAILAATTNVMAAQILIVASTLSEDFFKRLFKRNASTQELLFLSRVNVVVISIVAFTIAFFKISSIYNLVLYAWSGLGASFGPLLLLSLYSKRINKHGAFAGILVGGAVAMIWDTIDKAFRLGIPSMIVGFALSTITIILVSHFTRKKIGIKHV